MRRVYIAASRGRDPQNPTDCKHSVRGRSEQRFEINGGGYEQCPHVSWQGQLSVDSV